MATDHQTLLRELKELLDDQFREFKFHVREYARSRGLLVIPSSELANADRQKMAELINAQYRQEAVEVTQAALKEIGRNDLVENLDRAWNPGPMQLDGGNLK